MTKTYRRYFTNAPADYDYANTHEVRLKDGQRLMLRNGTPHEPLRIVMIPDESGFGIEAQRARYLSGNHICIDDEQCNEWLQCHMLLVVEH